MIPELEITCANKKYTLYEITVGKYKRYAELMKANDATEYENVMYYNMKALQMMFDNALSLDELEHADVCELMCAAKTMHFIAQDVITPMFAELGGDEAVQVEKSIFDDYDKENGYVEESEQEVSVWDSCLTVIDLITKTAIRVLRNSYSQVMNTNIAELIKYLKFEIETANKQ